MLTLPELVEQCRSRGVKITPQRVAIFEALRRHPGHPTAEELYQDVLKRHPNVSFATVYNTLQLLCEMGQVRELILDELRRRYDLNTDVHHHAVCRRCHGIQDIQPADGGAAAAAMGGAELSRYGFMVEGVAVEWTGLCAACRTQ